MKLSFPHHQVVPFHLAGLSLSPIVKGPLLTNVEQALVNIPLHMSSFLRRWVVPLH